MGKRDAEKVGNREHRKEATPMKVRDLLQVKGSAVTTIHPEATLYDALTANEAA